MAKAKKKSGKPISVSKMIKKYGGGGLIHFEKGIERMKRPLKKVSTVKKKK